MYTLVTKDGHSVCITIDVASQMSAIMAMIEDLDIGPENNQAIPVDVTHEHLDTIIKFCENPCSQAYLEKLPLDKLGELLVASNYLDLKTLLDLGCAAFAKNLAGKSVEEMRTILNVVNDFTPEEEEAIRAENAWAF